MKTPVTLRHIAGMGTVGDDSVIDPISSFYLERTTQGDLEEADRAYEDWTNGDVYNQMSRKQQNDVFDVIWGLVRAHSQYAFEAGIRTGFQLSGEIFSTPPSVSEIELQARAQRRTRKEASA